MMSLVYSSKFVSSNPRYRCFHPSAEHPCCEYLRILLSDGSTTDLCSAHAPEGIWSTATAYDLRDCEGWMLETYKVDMVVWWDTPALAEFRVQKI